MPLEIGILLLAAVLAFILGGVMAIALLNDAPTFALMMLPAWLSTLLPVSSVITPTGVWFGFSGNEAAAIGSTVLFASLGVLFILGLLLWKYGYGRRFTWVA